MRDRLRRVLAQGLPVQLGGAPHTTAEPTEGPTVHEGRDAASPDLTGGPVVSGRLAVPLSVEAPAPAGRGSADGLRKLSDPGQYTGTAGQLVDRVFGRFRLGRRGGGPRSGPRPPPPVR